jgi:hypothetical protein
MEGDAFAREGWKMAAAKQTRAALKWRSLIVLVELAARVPGNGEEITDFFIQLKLGAGDVVDDAGSSQRNSLRTVRNTLRTQ